jgi:hypothetical protein
MQVDEVIELRVHGVSGTPPEELLDRPLVERVAGNAVAGFYRPRLAAERTDSWPAGDPQPTVRGPQLEGYVWGGLTSGAPSRAFWLLLLPFTLINVAPRMRPADPSGPMTAGARNRLWLLWFTCRLLALTLTAVLVTAFAGIGVDLVGWQCGGGSRGRCAQASPGWIFDHITAWSTAHRLAIGVLLPLFAVLVLWWISKRTVTRYECTPSPLVDLTTPHPAWDRLDPPEASEVGLGSRWMWENDHPVRRLRALHVQVALATTLWFVSAPLATPLRWADGVVAAVIAGCAVAAICVPSFTGHRADLRWQRASYVTWGVLFATYAATLAWLLFVPDAVDGRYAGAAALPKFGDTLLVLLFVELVLLLVLAVTVAGAKASAGRRVVVGEPGPRPGVGGYGTAVLALMAVFLASVFTAGVYLYAATWLRTGSLKPGFGEVSRVSRAFTVPEPILDAALTFAVSVGVFLAAVLAAVVAIAVALHRLKPTSALLVPDSFTTDYPGRPNSGRGRAVLRAFWFGRVVDVAGTVIGVLMLAGAVFSYAVAGVLFAEHAFGAGAAARWLLDTRHSAGIGAFFTPSSLQGTGAYLVVISLLLLVGLGATAFRLGPTRRSLGILWDLASFWPRQAHPLAAPCYAERTVPELVYRMRWHTGNGTGVVLAAHSQGTVLGAAAVLQLRTGDAFEPEDPVLPRVGLLTFGCVLRRLYGRYFPAYFGPRTLRDLRTSLRRGPDDQRWRNLWRYSDYLGGPVLSGPPPAVAPAWEPGAAEPVGPGGLTLDLHLIDPPYDIAPGDTVHPAALRHSSFWAVPQFQRAVVRVARLIDSPGRRKASDVVPTGADRPPV